ncbi:MAG: 4Fe-4S dicluster domain-containing protein [Cyanothece sp. SIO2G6]|nr:4Fe-4S dicluster domain-containing protein [Cyanothece sp. SIO2G6]
MVNEPTINEPPANKSAVSKFDVNEFAINGFDSHHAPDPKHIDACVHCGFCLVTCPSYRVLGTEMDSPRGRIYLMDGIQTQQIPLNQATAQHFDSCLGCLACTTACPSGVPYDQLIAATRPQVERNQPRTLSDRLFRQLLFSLFPYPNRLRWFLVPLFLYQQLGGRSLLRSTPLHSLLENLSPRLAAMEALLPDITPASFQRSLPTVVPAQGKTRYRVGMVLGCVQQLFFSEVNAATVRVLTANGCEVVIPPSQGCCAALPHHQGQEAQAQDLARQMIDAFADTNVDAVVINAAGCGHTLKEYGQILQDDGGYRERAIAFSHRVKDIHEWLADIGLTASLHPLQEAPLPMVYQDACHLLHGQQISLQPRQLLRQIPGVELREPVDAALCCGSAGVYNMLQPDIAAELGQQKVENLLNTGATVIASPNPGCSLQIQNHLRLQDKVATVIHPIVLLDRAIRGASLAD